jgi:hypothetical protein
VERRELADRRERILGRTAVQLIARPAIAEILQQQEEMISLDVVGGVQTTRTWQRDLFADTVVEIDFAFVEFELAGEAARLFDRRREFRDHRLWTARFVPVRQLDARELAQHAGSLPDDLGLKRGHACRVETECGAYGGDRQIGRSLRIHPRPSSFSAENSRRNP